MFIHFGGHVQYKRSKAEDAAEAEAGIDIEIAKGLSGKKVKKRNRKGWPVSPDLSIARHDPGLARRFKPKRISGR